MKVALLTVEGSIASLKTAANALLIDMLVSLLTGMVELTVGDVVSGTAAVVQLHI
jgi:hypothetical protein